MAPPHVLAFQKFANRIPDRLQASIAFGIFMESEGLWAEKEGDPKDSKYRNYQQILLNEHEIDRFANEAREFLSVVANEAIASKQQEFLQGSLNQYREAARAGHRRFRWRGVLEAMIAAFLWTLLLIIMSFVLKYNGIDVIEIFGKVAAHR